MTNKDKRKEYNKKYVANHKEKSRSYYWKTKESRPDVYKCRYTLQNALRRGKLHKYPCAVCENTRVNAHHKDYTKPLEVIWLCPQHHKDVHFGRISA